MLDLLWKFLKPISFSLIGKEVRFSILDGKLVGYGVLLIVVGSLVSSVMLLFVIFKLTKWIMVLDLTVDRVH